MSIAIIALIAVLTAILATVGYVIRYNSLMKSAKRAMRKAHHHEQMAELSYARIDTYEEYAASRRAYRKAARLYLAAGEYTRAKFAVHMAVSMDKLYEKYLYM